MFDLQVRPKGRRLRGHWRVPAAIRATTRSYGRERVVVDRSSATGVGNFPGHRLDGCVARAGNADDDVTTDHDVIAATRLCDVRYGRPNQDRHEARGQQTQTELGSETAAKAKLACWFQRLHSDVPLATK